MEDVDERCLQGDDDGAGDAVTGDGAQEGRRRAHTYLTLLAAGDDEAAARLLAQTTGLHAMTYLGAAFTATSRRGARGLSPAQRAQATGRHMRISALRDGAHRNPEALRTWLEASAREAAFVQQMQTAAARAAETA